MTRYKGKISTFERVLDGLRYVLDELLEKIQGVSGKKFECGPGLGQVGTH